MMFLIVFVISLLGLDHVLIVSSIQWDTRNVYDEGSSSSHGLISGISSKENETMEYLRNKRSSLKFSGQCSVSEEALRSLHGEIKSTLAMTQTGSDTDCDIDENADKCDEILNLIQCCVDHLASGFTQASSNADDYTKWKNAFDNLSEKFNRQIDDVKRSVTQHQQRIIDSISSQMHSLSVRLKVALSQLSDVRIRYITSEIGHGRISSAVAQFKSLDDDSLLPDIIESTYNIYGDKKVFVNLVYFLRKFLQTCRLATAAYSTLYNVLSKNNMANSPDILLLANDVEWCHCFRDTPLRNYLPGHVQNVLNSWAKSIRGGSFDEVHSFAEKYSEEFGSYLKALIENAHDKNIHNIPNILDFIEQLDLDERIRAYTFLYHSARRAVNGYDGHEFIRLIYKIKVTLDRPDLTSEQRETLNGLKNGVPQGIYALLWNRNGIYIRSKMHPGNYLGLKRETTLVSSIFDVQTVSRRYTCRPSKDFFNLWKVEVHRDGRYFKFSTKDKEGKYWYLYDGLAQVNPVENGDYYYFVINEEALGAGDKMWSVSAYLNGMGSECTSPHLTHYETDRPTDYQKWIIF